jgi:hypothetical protein
VYDKYSDKDVYVVSLWRRLGCVVMSIVGLMPIIASTVLAHMGIFTLVHFAQFPESSAADSFPLLLLPLSRWIYRLNFHEVFVVNLCGDTVRSHYLFRGRFWSLLTLRNRPTRRDLPASLATKLRPE